MTRLTGYKRPRYVEFCEALPKAPIRKVLQRELRDAPKKAAAVSAFNRSAAQAIPCRP
jgi:acyl-coenzyme A synthetase/AMP-(fatty) acid ligase